MLTLRIDTKGIETMIARFASLLNDLEDRTEPHTTIKDKQNERWIDNFNSQGGHYISWPALSDSWMAKRDSTGPILQPNGGLFGNVQAQQSAAEVGRDATSWNFDDQPPHFPMTHHLGKPTSFKIPARPIWLVDNEDDVRSRDIMEEYVDAVIARYF